MHHNQTQTKKYEKKIESSKEKQYLTYKNKSQMTVGFSFKPWRLQRSGIIYLKS